MIGWVGKVEDSVRVALLQAALVDDVQGSCLAVDMIRVQFGQLKLELGQRFRDWTSKEIVC